MTSQEDTPPLIYIPTLHYELIGRQLPDGVLLLDPGLPLTAGCAAVFTPGNYPLSRKEAAAVLSELLSIGEALDLSNPKNIDSARAIFSESGISTEEARNLAEFASQGAPSPMAAPASPLIAAQKILLLAWDLEARLAEIHKLQEEIASAAKPLAEALRDPLNEEALSDAVSGLIPDVPDNAQLDWRLTLAAMAAFIPQDAVLITAHEDMRASLLDLGMLLPLPEDTAGKLANWPDSVKAASLWAKAPLWRVIGHAKPLENAPWLEIAPEIIVCPQTKTLRAKTPQTQKRAV